MDERSEVRTALTTLSHYRQRKTPSLLLQKPEVIRKGGFFDWLHKK